MTMNLFALLILAVFASEEKEDGKNGPEYGEKIGSHEKNLIIVKIEEDEYAKKKSEYVGVTYNKNNSKWRVRRWNKNENKDVSNGCYDDEKTAAHASDTLARELMENGGKNHKLNFPDRYTEVYPEEKSSKFIGVYYVKDNLKWKVQRFGKYENKLFYNGYYGDEETAAHASDTLARKLIKNGEQNHKLNFPAEYNEVYNNPEKSSKFIGVTYHKNISKWRVQRWSKHENRMVSNGYYDDEETAAHASDTLARKLIKSGEQNHKLNFNEDHTEIYPDKNATSKFLNKSCSKYSAHASDTLATKLIKSGEQIHEINFPEDHTDVYPGNQKNKRKRPKSFGLDHLQNN